MYSEFPGPIGPAKYQDQILQLGERSTFHDGSIYRYPAVIPLLEVQGGFYEMGIQYGVLLRPEILAFLESFDKILNWMASEQKIPLPDLAGYLIAQSESLSRQIPSRFIEEAQGISEGSGVPVKTILAASLFIDVMEGKGCTSILLREKGGGLIHGRNNDTAPIGGEELGKHTTLVRHRSKGYHTITQVDYPLFLGGSSICNDQGLAHSEETLTIRQPNPNGFPLYFLIRMGMEECATLQEVYSLVDRYRIPGASGGVWSSQKDSQGAIIELTPQGWSALEMKDPILWDFNQIYSPELHKYQHPRQNLVGSNQDREAIASAFPIKTSYDVHDALEFLRLQTGPGGEDYSWYGSKWPICNLSGQQTVVFDPHQDGFYVSSGPYYSARLAIIHIHSDFAQPPEIFKEAVLLDPLVEQVARIETSLIGANKKTNRLIKLADAHPENAQLQFLAGYNSYLIGRLGSFAPYVEKAYQLNTSVPEYRLCAGMAAYVKQEFDQAVFLMEGINPSDLNLEQELRRLTILEKAWARKGGPESSTYRQLKANLLQEQNAVDFFNSVWLPRLEFLGN